MDKIFLVAITFLLIFSSIVFSLETKNLVLNLIDPQMYLNVSRIIECSYGSTINTNCNQNAISYINSSDNTYGLAIFSIRAEQWGRYNFSTFFDNLRYDINVLDVKIGIEAYKVQGTWSSSSRTCIWSLLSSSSDLGDDSNDRCYVQIFENLTGNLNYYDVFPLSQNTCNLWETIDKIVESSVINYFNSLEKIKNSGIVFYGYDNDDRCTAFRIDWVFLNISYFDLTYSNYNFYNFFDNSILSESVNIKRGDIIKIGALFDITNVSYAYVYHNATGNFLKYDVINYSNLFSISNISQYKYWVNFTINTSNFTQYSKLGPITINITAVNEFGGYNTTYLKTFYLYGFSKVSEIYFNDSYLYPNEPILVSCRVIDANLSTPIQRYNVSFWINNNYIASKLTDSSGIASISFNVPQNLGDYTIKCNISDALDLYYYASEINEKSTTIKVLNLTLPIALNASTLNFGDAILLIANVTNASTINYVNVSIKYINISNGILVDTIEQYNLSFSKCYLPYLCEYKLEFIPKRSGNYKLTFEVDANSPYGKVNNQSSFFVNFGNSIINISFPNFQKILINQTFFAKVKLKAINGDLWLVNVSLNSSDFSKIKIEQIYHPALLNLTNGTEMTLEFNVSILDFGSVSLNATSIPQNGTYSTEEKTFEIIGFPVSVVSTSLNFGNYQNVYANISGNASEIKRVFAKVYFVNITEDCRLQNSYIELNLSFDKIVFENQPVYLYNLSFIPPRSGNYSIEIFVESNSIWFLENKTSDFNVSFGNSEIFVLNPYYYVLTNQTFYTTIGIKAINGDLWFVSTNISILNPYAINLTNDEFNYHSNVIEGIANGTFCIDKWRSSSRYNAGSEITTITFYAFPQHGSSSSYSESFEVILPDFVKEATFIEPNVSFIDEFVLIKARIFGNASSFKINSSIFKPFNSGIENIIFETAIPKNYSECKINIEKGNVASTNKGSIANASIKNENAIFVIDEKLDTYWSQLNSLPAQINITFPKIVTLDRIEITWETGSTTYANVSYVDASDNIIRFLENIQVNQSKSKIIHKFTIPIKAKKIIIDVSNIVAIYEVQAFPVEPRLDYCYEFYFNFTNFTRSGTYYVNFEAISNFSDKIYYPNSSFFINFGIPLLKVSDKTYPAMLSGQTQNYSIILTAYRGDLLNVTLIFSSSDQEYINITSDETFEKNVSELLWKNSTEIAWNIQALIKNEPNKTVLTFVNTSCNYCYSNNSIEFSITIYPLDIEPPKIIDFWFKKFAKNTSTFNLFDSASIIANVVDNIFVAKVIAEIKYPNDSLMLNASLIRSNLWVFNFSTNNVELNQTGNFSIRIYAFDLNETHNFDISNYKNISVVDIYFIDYEPKYAIYNFGEKIIFFAKDVNDFIVDKPIWNESNYNISNESTFFEIFLSNSTFNTGMINLSVNVTKKGNKGYLNLSFELSNKLLIDIISPPNNYIFEPGTSIAGPGLLPTIRVYNVRKDKELQNLNSLIYCLDSSYNFTYFDSSFFYYNACGFLTSSYSFKDCQSQCYAPNSYNQNFNISFLVFDDFGNYGFDYINLKTKELVLSSQPSGGAAIGGGFGAPAIPTKQCTCENWQNVGCGKGKCKANEMYQIRKCNPSGCAEEERCIPSIECVPPKIEVDVDENVTLIQGYEKTIKLTVKNVGEKDVILVLSATSDCCNITLSDNKIHLKINDYREVGITIKSLLTLIPKEYLLTLLIYNEENKELIYQKSIRINVEKNKLFEIFSDIQERGKELMRILEEYEKLNLLTSEELQAIENFNSLIFEIVDNIKKSDTISFEKNVNELLKTYNYLKNAIENKKIYYYFSKHQREILIGILLSLIAYYFLSQIILPYLKISKEIKKLSLEESSLLAARLELQKQFFMRKISEELFKKMIMEKQSRILEIRGKIKKLKEEQTKLLKERVNPIYMFKLLKNLFVENIKRFKFPRKNN